MAVDGDALRLSTAAGDLTLPLLAADRSNAQRANVARLDAQAFDVTAPFALAHAKRPCPQLQDTLSPVRSPAACSTPPSSAAATR